MSRVRHRVVPTLLPFAVCVVLTSWLAVSCGSDADDSSLPGKALANEYGCMACHGSSGEGGTGPAWKGLYGSKVSLEDGRVVTVDRDYLVRSIVDPEADRPAGALLKMPKNTIPAVDVESIVDYLVSLG
jgi:cytochrome c oxidase subunit 2